MNDMQLTIIKTSAIENILVLKT